MAKIERIRCKNCREPINLADQKNGRLKCPACGTMHKLRPEHIRPRWKALRPEFLMMVGGIGLVILVLIIIISVASCSGGKPEETTTVATTTTEAFIDPEWEDALLWGQDYLSRAPFSYAGLVDQLMHDGYTQDAAIYAADNCGVDWYTQAEMEAESLMTLGGFDRQGLIDTLMMEGYTEAEAASAADTVGLWD